MSFESGLDIHDPREGIHRENVNPGDLRNCRRAK